MNTIIIYASKYGFSKLCAERLASKVKNSTLVNIKENNNIDLTKYENIVIGASVYAGSVDKVLLEFCHNHMETLLNKNIFLFSCGLRPYDSAISMVPTLYPKELADKSIAIEYFGGEVNYNKMSFMERIIIRIITKSKENIINILNDKIDLLATKINEI